MLILQRSAGESIIVEFNGATAIVTVTELTGGAARLGVDAPRAVNVDRLEVAAARIAGGRPCEHAASAYPPEHFLPRGPRTPKRSGGRKRTGHKRHRSHRRAGMAADG